MIVIVIFLFGQKLFAQFEGVIDMKVVDSTGDSVQTENYSLQVQGNKVSADFHEADASKTNGKFIFRGDKKLLWIIDDDQKKYIELSTKDQPSGKDSEQTHKATSSEKLHKTGKKEALLGYTCDEMVTHKDGDEVRIWATKKLGNIYEGLSQSLGELSGKEEQGGWEHELAVMKMFPLKVTTIRKNAPAETQEVTRIHEEKLSASVFLPPDGYEKQSFDLNMKKLLQQMQDQNGTQETIDSTGNH